jgi:selenoprotein W-related protein
LSARLLERFKQKIASLELIPSKGGCFEVQADGELIYSKLREGRFPDESQILTEIAQRFRAKH